MAVASQAAGARGSVRPPARLSQGEVTAPERRARCCARPGAAELEDLDELPQASAVPLGVRRVFGAAEGGWFCGSLQEGKR